MSKLNCALVHVPKLTLKEDKTPQSEINFFAMGLFSIGNYIKQQGFDVEIIHLGLNKLLDKNFLLSEYIKKKNIKFLAFSLHWYPQTFDTIETARVIKEKCPDVFISLGGYSASFFADEIMEKFTFIDAIITGEGEIPTSILVKELNKNVSERNFNEIPNLIYRTSRGEIIKTKKKYNATNLDLNRFNFFDKSLIQNYHLYSKMPYLLDYSRKNELNNPQTVQGICLGRGCSGNCAWCGGGFEAVKKMTGRDFISYRNIYKVISDIKKLKNECNIEIFRFAFDPIAKNKKYLFALFEKIKDEFKGKITIEYSAHSLPNKEFIYLFKEACSNNSTIIFAPEFYNENLRKKYKSFYYSNEQLIEILDLTEELKINSILYFSIVPNVDVSENVKSKEFAEFLLNKYKYVKEYYISEVEIVPISYWTMYPEKFNLNIKQRSIFDYYNTVNSVENSFENTEIFN